MKRLSNPPNQAVSAFLNFCTALSCCTFLAMLWFRCRRIDQEVCVLKGVAIHCGEPRICWKTLELVLNEFFCYCLFSDQHRTTLRIISRIRRADSGLRAKPDPKLSRSLIVVPPRITGTAFTLCRVSSRTGSRSPVRAHWQY